MTNRFDLVIFDCDGVLVDSEPIANRVLCERLGLIGFSLAPEEVMSRFVGRTRGGVLGLVAELYGRELPKGFAEQWDIALFEALREEVEAIDGIVEVLRGLRLPYCVASNGTPDRLRLTLDASGLLPLFEGRIFCAADVAHPKPAPDLFLHAASVMGAQPSRTAVIEDTPTGARAGRAAGMSVFGYAGAGPHSRGPLEREGATVFGMMRDLPSLLGVNA